MPSFRTEEATQSLFYSRTKKREADRKSSSLESHLLEIMLAGSNNNLIQQFKAITSKTEKFEFVCASIQSYREKSSHVSPSQADDFLCAVLPFMEANIDFVNRHDETVRVLIGIIQDHAASRYDKSVREYSFSYHDSYEKAIFIVLSMVETSSVLKGFMAAVNRLNLVDTLVQSFGKVLIIDISYATQVRYKFIFCARQ